MRPTEGRQSVSLGGHPKSRRTPGTWRISPTDISLKKISLASSVVGAALLGVASVGAHAAQNPFAVQELSSGYSVAAAEKAKEGSCGEAKCGADKGKREASKAGHEGSCGADRKAKEGSCGGEKKAGEGNCGADKKKS